MRRWTLVLCALSAGLLLLSLPRCSPEHGPADGERLAPDAVAMPGERVRAAASAPGRAEPADREAVVLPDPMAFPSPEWTVRLLGIDPEVPWTAPLQLVFQDQFDVRGFADAEGVFRFVPPAGARLPGITLIRLVAADPHYRVQPCVLPTVGLQETGQQDFPVFPVARLRGRVLGPDGAGIAARVRAFVGDAAGPREPLLARTTADADGRYELRVPPGTPVLVLADAVHEDVAALLSSDQVPVLLRHLQARSPDELLPDHRQPSRDLLPAGLRTEAMVREERVVPDLRLVRPASLSGTVTFADGRPWAAARVRAAPTATSVPWHAHLYWSPLEGLVAGAEATTDDRGHFAMPLAPGVAMHLVVESARWRSPDVAASIVAAAPDEVAIVTAGTPLLVRALSDGVLATKVHIDVDAATVPAPTGELSLVLGPGPVRLRARTGERWSAWQALPSANRPAVLTLELAPVALADVTIRLRSDQAVTEAVFVWQPLPTGPRQQDTLACAGRDDPFRLRMPPGRYRLTVCGRAGAPGGDYLMPMQIDLDVPPAGFHGSYEVEFGSRLELDVFDANGIRVGGSFRLLDAGQRDVTPATMAWSESGAPRRGAVGELLPHNLNLLDAVLAAGEHTLTVQSGTRSARQGIRLRRNVTTRVAVPLR